MGRYEIILEKVPKSEPEKEIVKEAESPKGQTLPKFETPYLRSWEPPPGLFGDYAIRSEPPSMSVTEIRRLNRHSFLTDHSCFDAVSRASEENNRLLPRLGYHRFRQLVIQTAREFFIIGDAFLIWEGERLRERLMILDPDHIQIRYIHNSYEYYLISFSADLGLPMTHVGITSSLYPGFSHRRLSNVYHISRRLMAYDLMGRPIIFRNLDDPAVYEIPNIGIERYVSQFVDAWVNSNIMSGI